MPHFNQDWTTTRARARENLYEDVIPGVLAYKEGETRQVKDIRKRYVMNLKEPHVQPERVYRVHLAQNDLAAADWTRDSPEPKPTPSPPLRTATQTRLRASLAVRAVSATVESSAATASSHPAPLEAGDL